MGGGREADSAERGTASIFRRIVRNVGLLISGKTAGALLSLGYLAVSARALGVEPFGVLVLVQSYMQLVRNIVNLQPWRAIIRYGAQCLEEERQDDFRALVKLTTMVDVTGAIVASGAGIAAAPFVGAWLGWDGETIGFARLYVCGILSAVLATPTGILHLFDRFGLLAGQATVTPALRLAGCAGAYALGGGLTAFVLVWFVTGVVGNLVLVAIGWRELARRGLASWHAMPGPSGLVRLFPGFPRFILWTGLHNSLTLVTGNLTTMLVGGFAGAGGAGLFRIAQQFGTALTKPAEMLMQALYPNLAKLWHRGEGTEMRALVLKPGLVAGSVIALVLVIAALFGEEILSLTMGPDFVAAYGALLLLAAAAAVAVYGVAFEPTILAIGRPELPFRINAVVTGAYFPLMVVLTHSFGIEGAAAASVLAAFANYGTLAWAARRLMARASRTAIPQ